MLVKKTLRSTVLYYNRQYFPSKSKAKQNIKDETGIRRAIYSQILKLLQQNPKLESVIFSS